MTKNNLYYDNNHEIENIINKLKKVDNLKMRDLYHLVYKRPNDYKITQKDVNILIENERKDAKKVLKKHYYERMAKSICGVNEGGKECI